MLYFLSVLALESCRQPNTCNFVFILRTLEISPKTSKKINFLGYHCTMYYIIGNILLGYSKIFNFIKTRIANKCSDTLWKLIVFLQQVQDGQ